MHYFHDSTVILGYIFCGADRWGQQATDKINDPIPNHSSKYVWEECFGAQYDDGYFDKGRCGTIKNQIARESRRVILKIQQNVPLSDIITQLRDEDFRTTDLFQQLFSQYGDNPQLVEILKTAFRRFEGLCFQRYSEINNEEKIKRLARRNSYIDLFNDLLPFIPDVADIEIIIDGHHLATKIPDVVLVTGDEGHIYLNKRYILKKTGITDVIWLGNS
jgi:hypothetical protein